MITPRRTAVVGVLQSLLLATLLCLVFYLYRLYDMRSIGLTYLPWNLFLAWLPLGVMVILIRLLRTRRWSDWLPIAVTIVWVLFLPNSFYLVSDYIHLQNASNEVILYDAVMFTMFVFTGLLLGYASLYVFHTELRKRMPGTSAWRVIWLVVLLCSFAIYIGRDLRWNSWDILVSPAGLLFDISERFLRVGEYGTMLGTVMLFFALLGGMYYVGWRLSRVLGHLVPRDVERPPLL